MSSKHIVPVNVYLRVFATLMGLMVLTVLAALVNLGPLSTPIALFIAVVKGVLIVLFFMHVKYAGKMTWIFSGAAFLWLGIMLALTFSDYAARGSAPNTIREMPHVSARIAERSGHPQPPSIER